MFSKLAFSNVKKSIKDYAIYFFTLVFGVCVFYAFNSIESQQAILELSTMQRSMLDTLNRLITGLSAFIAVILGFLVVYASRYIIGRRKKEFGIYMTLGMSKGNLSRILTLETLFIGAVSLVVGLMVGIIVSQGLSFVTASLFEVDMKSFTFVFSKTAFVKTLLYFSVIYLIVMIFDVGSISRYKLIDLINAKHKSEDLKMRKLWVSVVTFVLSLTLIIAAYLLLRDGGIIELAWKFYLSTGLVIAGTFLLFFSLSGIMLRVVQMNRRFYLRGLTMFVLRQLNSKINTNFVSMSFVTLALFVAMTTFLTGMGVSNVFTKNLEEVTPYDATLESYSDSMDVSSSEGSEDSGTVEDSNRIAEIPDMTEVLSSTVDGWNEVVGRSTQVDLLMTSFTYGSIYKNGLDEFANQFAIDPDEVEKTAVPVIAVSEYNAARILQGLEPIELGENEYALNNTFGDTASVLEEFLDAQETITIDGIELEPSDNELLDVTYQTTSMAGDTGTLIVPDAVADKLVVVGYESILDIQYKSGALNAEESFNSMLEEAYPDDSDSTPFFSTITKQEMFEQSAGLNMIIAYLAIYIGLIFLITCAAVLALQQLSEASDNIERYSLLEKIGADSAMISKALFVQIGIYFLLPLLVAISHSVVATGETSKAISLLGHLDIVDNVILTGGFFLVIYGSYFLLTYVTARSMIRPRKAG